MKGAQRDVSKYWDIFKTYVEMYLYDLLLIFFHSFLKFVREVNISDCLLFPTCRFKTVHCLLYADTDWCPKLKPHHKNWKPLSFDPAPLVPATPSSYHHLQSLDPAVSESASPPASWMHSACFTTTHWSDSSINNRWSKIMRSSG